MNLFLNIEFSSTCVC